MTRIMFLLLTFFLFWNCQTKKSALPSVINNAPSPLEAKYYEQYNGNLARLHQLMLGTFVAYTKKEGEQLEQWNVTESDSVVLYSVPIGDVTKQGYWIFSYEFMTSLPNNPIYTSIKQVVQKDRDTFEVSYYKAPQGIKLIDILEKNVLVTLDFKKLVKTSKITTYVRQSNTHFSGFSEIYEDKDCNCLRQNSYDIKPELYSVDATFFNLKDQSPLAKKNRPNEMVRRLMDKELLLKIARKEYEIERSE